MTVYVDDLVDYGDIVQGKARRYGTVWCHLTCGGNCEELHQFAAQLGLRRAYAQMMNWNSHYFHHYDITPSKRDLALRKGAIYKSAQDHAMEELKA